MSSTTPKDPSDKTPPRERRDRQRGRLRDEADCLLTVDLRLLPFRRLFSISVRRRK